MGGAAPGVAEICDMAEFWSAFFEQVRPLRSAVARCLFLISVF